MPFPRFILDVLLGAASAWQSIRSGLRVVICHLAGIAANYGLPPNAAPATEIPVEVMGMVGDKIFVSDLDFWISR
jgi:hypothetical protein